MGDENKTEEPSRFFARLRFQGERFERSFIPVDALPAIKAYQETLLALASSIWKSDNPGKRLPRRFSEKFQLGLEGIGEGSKIARLPLMDFSPQASLEFDERNAFIDAQDRLAAVMVNDPSSGRHFALPEAAIPPFLRIGKSIDQGEAILVSPDAEGRSSTGTFRIDKNSINRVLEISRHREKRTISDVGVIVAIQESPSLVRVASTYGAFSYSIPYRDLLSSEALLIGSVASFKISAEVDGAGQLVRMLDAIAISPAIDDKNYLRLLRRVDEILEQVLDFDEVIKITNSTIERAQRFSKWIARKIERVRLSISSEGSIQYEWLQNDYACSLAISEAEFLFGVSDLRGTAFKERSFTGASPLLLASIENASIFLPRGRVSE